MRVTRMVFVHCPEQSVLFSFSIYHFHASARLGIGTFSGSPEGCQGFTEPNLSALLYKSKTSQCEEGFEIPDKSN